MYGSTARLSTARTASSMRGSEIVHGGVDERLAQRLADLLGEARAAPRPALPRPLDPGAVPVERGHELGDPLASRRDALHDGRRPAPVLGARRRRRRGLHVTVRRRVGRVAAHLRERADRLVAERDHQLEVAHRRVGALAVGLVHGEDVGALEDARLDGLHLVAHPGRHHDQRRVRRARDLELVLARPPPSRRARRRTRTRRGRARRRARSRESPPMCPRVASDRMNTPVVGRVALHADAVAEDGAARVRARRIDGDDADALAPRARYAAMSRSTSVDLPGARVAGDAEDPRLARVRPERLQQLDVPRRPVVHHPQRPRDCPRARSASTPIRRIASLMAGRPASSAPAAAVNRARRRRGPSGTRPSRARPSRLLRRERVAQRGPRGGPLRELLRRLQAEGLGARVARPRAWHASDAWTSGVGSPWSRPHAAW